MDERTVKALRGSIAKWRAIVADEAIDEGPENCPLCHKFWRYPQPCTGRHKLVDDLPRFGESGGE